MPAEMPPAPDGDALSRFRRRRLFTPAMPIRQITRCVDVSEISAAPDADAT